MNKFPELIVLSSDNKGSSFILKNKAYTCGRSVDSDIHFSDLTINSNHCEFVQMDKDIYSIINKDSTNGTKVNNQSIENYVLKNGDIIKFGNTELLYSYKKENLKKDTNLGDAKTKIDLTKIGDRIHIEEMKNLSPFSEENNKFKSMIIKKATFYIFIIFGIIIITLLAWLFAIV